MSDPMSGTWLENVTVVRGGMTVLQDVTLRAADGELLVVLGSSGSGKSTLLRVLAGLEEVSSGSVVINGRDVTRLPPGERRVAMVFETSALIPFLDVSRNLGWGLRAQRLPETEVERRVEERAWQLRLRRLLARRPNQLSQGQQTLVGIGHALVQRPDLFLLDEPLKGLDAAERARVRREIVRTVHSLGATSFFVTHDQAEGLAVADRVALLHDGAVVQVGTPRELYERPADLFAAEFVGTPPIGLLPARLVSVGGQAAFIVGNRTLPLWRAVPLPLRAHVGREVVLGLRAEDVHDPTASPDPDAVALDAVVREVEFAGRHNVVSVAVGAPAGPEGGSQLAVEKFRAGTLRSFFPARSVVRPGTAATVAVKASSAHVFDAVTGRALWHPEPLRTRR